MARRRAASNLSSDNTPQQELGSMYDYLAKIILLGPSGSGKTCLLHRYTKGEQRKAATQTIGVEFASKIVKIGTGTRRRRIKLQFWDTAGTERFQALSRSYYRGAAGAILVYDIASLKSFQALPNFLKDVRSLASPHVALILVGNKIDLDNPDAREEEQRHYTFGHTDGGESIRTTESYDSRRGGGGGTLSSAGKSAAHSSFHSHYSDYPQPSSSRHAGRQDKGGGDDGGSLYNDGDEDDDSSATPALATSLRNPHFMAGTGSRPLSTLTGPECREVGTETATRWAREQQIPLAMEVSAHQGTNVEDVFTRIAEMILIKIEIGEVDPTDPASGVQYGDMPSGQLEDEDFKNTHGGRTVARGGDSGNAGEGSSNDAFKGLRQRRSYINEPSTWRQEWGEVFGINSRNPSRSRRGCC